MSYINTNPADDTASLKILQKCTHCGEETTKGSKYCKLCIKAAHRHELDAENEKILGYPIKRNSEGMWIR